MGLWFGKTLNRISVNDLGEKMNKAIEYSDKKVEEALDALVQEGKLRTYIGNDGIKVWINSSSPLQVDENNSDKN